MSRPIPSHDVVVVRQADAEVVGNHFDDSPVWQQVLTARL